MASGSSVMRSRSLSRASLSSKSKSKLLEMMEEAQREQFLRIYAQTRTIAVIGASADASKAAHKIPRYLQSQGYRILPVNPRGGKLFGEQVFRSLTEIDVPVDVVEVFRPAQEAPEIARQAVAIGAKVLWLLLKVLPIARIFPLASYQNR